ncbi:MAG TPA: hypothetical protein EYP57_00225 [Thermodesulfobacteriaceae bacterium]|nr:hypothetical protein [Thermodesulfobacteriaceae bacterium]
MGECRKTDWLRDRRDFIVKNIVKNFIRSYAVSINIKDRFENNGLKYEGFDRWVGSQENRGLLWVLKDDCHRLWKDVDLQSNSEAFFFDWTIGAIFHEAMKLKESVYLIHRYQPVLETARNSVEHCSAQYRNFFSQVQDDAANCIERLSFLFPKAAQYLRSFMMHEKDNSILVRFIIKKEETIQKILGRNQDGNTVLETMFPEGLERAYCMAGEHYLEGSWFSEARSAFEKALEIDSRCHQARSGLCILERRIKDLIVGIEKECAIAQRHRDQNEIYLNNSKSV